MKVFAIKMGFEPQPPSPKKGMNKHGMGRKPVKRQRSSGSKGGSARSPSAVSPVSVLCEHQLLLQVDDAPPIAPPADAIVVPGEPGYRE